MPQLDEIALDYATVEHLSTTMVMAASQLGATVPQTACAAAMLLARIYGQEVESSKEVQFIKDLLDYAGLYYGEEKLN